jgi:hypothetical protein
MAWQRSLLRCSRCFYTTTPLPTNSRVSQPPDLSGEPMPISLLPGESRKVAKKHWETTKDPDAKDGDYNTLKEFKTVKDKLFQKPKSNLAKQVARGGNVPLPPTVGPGKSFSTITKEDATHCVLMNVPLSYLSDDVKRLIPFDQSKQHQHPLAEGIHSPHSINE